MSCKKSENKILFLPAKMHTLLKKSVELTNLYVCQTSNLDSPYNTKSQKILLVLED